MNQSRQDHITTSRFTARLFAGALLCLMSLATHAGVIAVSSNLQVQATAGRTTTEVIDIASDSQGATINNLGTVSALAVSGTLTTSGSASASWSSAAAGNVTFNDLGWNNGPSDTSFSSITGTEWRYTFIADIDGLFTMDFDIQLDPNNNCLCGAPNFGLNSFRFSLVGPSGGFMDILNAGPPGTTTRNIYAGNQYTALISAPNSIFGGVGNRDSHMNGTFNWSMDSGPTNSVPAPLSLMVFSIGLLFVARSVCRRGQPYFFTTR